MTSVVFEFTREQVNAGTHYAPGARIDLPEGQALRLRTLGAGQIVDTPTDSDESPDPSPRARKRR